MDGYQFISSLVGSLAWPIAAVIAVALLRRPISELLRRLRNAKYGEASVEFSDQIQRATITAEQIEATTPQLALPLQEPVEEKDRFTKLAELAPTLAIIDAWRAVEDAVVALAQARNIEPTPVRYVSTASAPLRKIAANPGQYVVELQNSRILDARTSTLLSQLRSLRNLAAHKRDYTLSPEDALRYKSLADTVVAALQSAAALPEPEKTASG